MSNDGTNTHKIDKEQAQEVYGRIKTTIEQIVLSSMRSGHMEYGEMLMAVARYSAISTLEFLSSQVSYNPTKIAAHLRVMK